MYDFVTSWTGDLENIGSLNNADLPNIGAKITLINITTDLDRKVPPLRSCHAHGGKYKFSKILTFACKLEFYHWQKILSVVFLEVTGSTSFNFEKMSGSYPSLNSHSSSVSHPFK